MLKVGITGGIGSGKSTVCRVFETLGIPVFYADEAAKFIINSDVSIVARLKKLFGDDVYLNGSLDKQKVASLIFTDSTLLAQMNAIVHPATIAFGKEWMASQNASYVIKEAAIFFESGSNKEMDVMIGVYAPLEVRINRIIERDNAERNKVLDRISKQMNEEEKMTLCDYVITNDENTAITPQVLDLHKKLLEKTG